MDLTKIPTEELEKMLAEKESETSQGSSQDLSKFSDSELEQMLAKEQGSAFDTAKNYAKAAIVEPASEMIRGLNQGTSEMMRNIDVVVPGDMLTQGAQALDQSTEQNIPQPEFMGKGATSLYRGLGKVVPDVAGATATMGVAKLAGIPKLLNMGANAIQRSQAPQAAIDFLASAIKNKAVGQSLTDSTYFATQNALKAAREDGDVSKAAIEGVGAAMAGNLFFPALGQTMSLGKKMGRAWVEFTTGSKKLADNYVKDPWKFNTNKFSGKNVDNWEDVQREGQEEIKLLVAQNDSKFLDVKQKADQAVREAEFRNNQAMTKLERQHKRQVSAYSSLRNVDAETAINQAESDLEQALATTESTVQTHAEGVFAQLNAAKESAGEILDSTIDKLQLADPTAGIKFGAWRNKFFDFLKENSLHIKDGVIYSKSPATANKSIIDTLNSVYTEIKQVARGNSGVIPLSLVQAQRRNLKGHPIQTLQQLGGAINPARMESTVGSKFKGVTEGAIVTKAQKLLSFLSDANRTMSSKIKSMKEASGLFTKTTPDGQVVVDSSAMFKNFIRGDRKTLAQLHVIDSQLPDNMKMLPILKNSKSNIDSIQSKAVETIALAKKKVVADISKLKQELSEQTFKLREATARKDFRAKQAIERHLFETKNKLAKLTDLQKERLDRLVQFHKDQELLRSFIGKGRAGNIQTGAVMSVGGSTINPNVFQKVLPFGMAATGIGSPVVASNSVKVGMLLGKLIVQANKATPNSLKPAIKRGIASTVNNA